MARRTFARHHLPLGRTIAYRLLVLPRQIDRRRIGIWCLRRLRRRHLARRRRGVGVLLCFRVDCVHVGQNAQIADWSRHAETLSRCIQAIIPPARKNLGAILQGLSLHRKFLWAKKKGSLSAPLPVRRQLGLVIRPCGGVLPDRRPADQHPVGQSRPAPARAR